MKFTVLRQFVRNSSFKAVHPRPININPPTFLQTIVHSDGSTFRIKTTSPKSMITLTKDTINHSLWNPLSQVVDDEIGELAKFEQRFGDLSGLDFVEAKETKKEAKPNKKK
ncbi:hypothetical protein HDV04_003097 [Boothiomyces sp. JEL0838]|nr:hypothetical protein HDV04_004346 [Boothiomyces sp. JEL0838]KAJ3312497.1 hypothetical protein HDV04_003097 [Boothiomyces sp. JEL0838]